MVLSYWRILTPNNPGLCNEVMNMWQWILVGSGVTLLLHFVFKVSWGWSIGITIILFMVLVVLLALELIALIKEALEKDTV